MSEQIEKGAETVGLKRSAEIGKLITALCKAQQSFDPIYKESENPAFKRGNRVSKYADLFSLVTATRKHLNANGLTIMQFPTVTLEGKNLSVTTMVAHESGEWISHELVIPAVDERGFTAHSIGKAMTYARRYSWQSVIGAVAEDDDDGNDASGVGSREAAQEVGRQKIAKLKGVDVLFYTEPEAHKGFFVEFVNMKAYGSALNEVAQEGLRQILKPYISKITKDETVLVSSSRIDALLAELENSGVKTKKLEAA